MITKCHILTTCISELGNYLLQLHWGETESWAERYHNALYLYLLSSFTLRKSKHSIQIMRLTLGTACMATHFKYKVKLDLACTLQLNSSLSTKWFSQDFHSNCRIIMLQPSLYQQEQIITAQSPVLAPATCIKQQLQFLCTQGKASDSTTIVHHLLHNIQKVQDVSHFVMTRDKLMFLLLADNYTTTMHPLP